MFRGDLAGRIDAAIGERNASDLARRVRKSRQALSGYRSGARMPDAEVLSALCRELNISADWLLGLPQASSEVREGGAPYGPEASRLELLEQENATLRVQVTQLQVDLRAAERALATALTTNVIEAAKEAVGMMAAEGKAEGRKKKGA